MNKDDNVFETEEYKKLLKKLKDIMERAKAAGVDLFDREDYLSCEDCGAHEDTTIEGVNKVYDNDKNPTEHDRFIVIDSTEKTYQGDNGFSYETTHSFICTVCGLAQEEIFSEEFDE